LNAFLRLERLSACTIITDMISFEDFSKVDIRAGYVEECTKVEGSVKLIRLIVDFGELGKKQILTALGEFFTPEQVQGLTALFVVNMTPRKLMGFESEGMIMGTEEDLPKILLAPEGVAPGTRII